MPVTAAILLLRDGKWQEVTGGWNGIISRLGRWEGYEVDEGWEEQRGPERWCVVRLWLVAGKDRICSGCGRLHPLVHDCEERRMRNLPIFKIPVELIVPRLQVTRPQCGGKLERLDWLEGYARVTTRPASSVARLCHVMSIRRVARFCRLLTWTTVKRIDFRYPQRTLGLVDLLRVTVIGMDEFAIQTLTKKSNAAPLILISY